MKENHIRVPGLADAAEIRIDRWGVPHISAASEPDLFFAQGFNAARDRLWQIDLWRKKGLGLLAQDFGPGFLAQDYASRLFLYRGDMGAEWAATAPDAQAICEAFAAGVNAYVDLAAREPERLPPEFSALGTQPARWAAQDILRIRTHAISQNALSEIVRSHVLAGADPGVDIFRKNLNPPVALEPTQGCAQPAPLAAVDLLRLATAQPTFSKARMAATMSEAWDWSGVDEFGEVVRRADARPPVEGLLEGSNNWAIAPARSKTGRPILANDPHRVLRNPSLRYIAHLSAPGLDVIGAGEPFLPGVSIGHNGRIAFGLTIFYIDQEDVFVFDTRADGGRNFSTETETFAIKGEAARALKLKFSTHGPIVYEEAGRAIAIRSVWAEPGAAPYARALASMRARTLDEFRQSVRLWGTPAVNHVCADISGAIGWIPSGFWPKRVGWNGLAPAPATRGWDGLNDCENLPRVIDPPLGYVASANEMNLPKDYAGIVGYEWIDPARADRIAEFFAERDKLGIADCCALQTDIHSLPARALLALVEALAFTHPARDLLNGWNGLLHRDAPAAALYQIWWMRHLRPATLDALAPDAATRALLNPGDMARLILALQGPDPRLTSAQARDALLVRTLESAWADARALLGDDPALWRWGALHRMYFDHALSEVDARFKPAAPPLPMSGDATSVMHMAWRPNDFRIVTGASVRLVIDVGEWDDSCCINAPGQSGDPRSPHYGDLAEIWAGGGYAPLLYSRARVEAATQEIIRLEPAT